MANNNGEQGGDYRVTGMSGWLEKKGKDLLQGWKKRWCVFEDTTRTLKYYDRKEPEVRKMKGEILVSLFWDLPRRQGVRAGRFDLRSEAGVLYAMAAPSESQKAIWVAKLTGAIGAPANLDMHPRSAEFVDAARQAGAEPAQPRRPATPRTQAGAT